MSGWASKMWNKLFEEESKKSYYKELMNYINEERKEYDIYPPEDQMYNAFECAYEDVRVVILGQDPYHQKGQAMGMSFSVAPGFPLPKSLINIYKELKNDLGVDRRTGDLSAWRDQGVFLLNALLTVRDSQPASHKNKGWEVFTDRVITYLSERQEPIVFILWGRWAESKKKLIADHHHCIISAHPSPLGAYRGFWDSKPFSRANSYLVEDGFEAIDWGKE